MLHSVELQAKSKQMPKLLTLFNFKDFETTPAYLLVPIVLVLKKFLEKMQLLVLPIKNETAALKAQTTSS